MRYQTPILPLLLLPFTLIVLAPFVFFADNSVTSQTRDKRVPANGAAGQKQNSNRATSNSTPKDTPEVVKVDIDLVKVDALVLQKNTARIVLTVHRRPLNRGGSRWL